MNSLESFHQNPTAEQIRNHLHDSTKAILENGGISLIQNLAIKFKPVCDKYINDLDPIDYNIDFDNIDWDIEERLLADSYSAFCNAELPLTIDAFNFINQRNQATTRYRIVKVDNEGITYGTGYTIFEVNSEGSEIKSFMPDDSSAKKLIESAFKIVTEQNKINWKPQKPPTDSNNFYKFINDDSL